MTAEMRAKLTIPYLKAMGMDLSRADERERNAISDSLGNGLPYFLDNAQLQPQPCRDCGGKNFGAHKPDVGWLFICADCGRLRTDSAAS